MGIHIGENAPDLDTREHARLVHALVARVDDTDGIGPAVLNGLDSGPEDPLASTACIATPRSREPGDRIIINIIIIKAPQPYRPLSLKTTHQKG